MDNKDRLDEKILEHWRKYQCDNCREGHREKCNTTEKNAKAFRIDENGKRHYYCFMGCLMLELDDESRKKIIESQFNDKGHYEKSSNALYNDSELIRLAH